jgi:hypothetical protein
MDNKKGNLQSINYNDANNIYISDKNNEEKDSEILNDFKSVNLIHSNLFSNSENDSNNINLAHMPIDKEPLILIEREDIKEEEKEETIGEKKLLGRKRKDSLTEGKHNKFSHDNMNRKIKCLILHFVYLFINSKISELYKNEPGYLKEKYELKKIEQSQVVNSNIRFNQNFLNETLEHIFSVNISHRYKKYDLEHNKNLINRLLNDKNIKRRQIFHNLFAKTFLECLEHFRGTKNIHELEGIKTFDKIKGKYEDDPDYLASLEYKLKIYEDIVRNQKWRNKRIKE